MKTRAQIKAQNAAHDALLDRASRDRRVKRAFRLLYFLRRRHNYKSDVAPFHAVATLASGLDVHTKTVKRDLELLGRCGYLVFHPLDADSMAYPLSISGRISYRLAVDTADKTVHDLDKTVHDLDKTVQISDKTVHDLDKTVRRPLIYTETRTELLEVNSGALAGARERIPFLKLEEHELRTRFSQFEILFGVSGTYTLVGRDGDLRIFWTRDEFDRLVFEDSIRARLPFPASITIDNSSIAC